MTEINWDFDGVLPMILNMRKIYTRYINKANKVDDQHDQIQTWASRLEQDLYIINKEREQALNFFKNRLKILKNTER